MSQKAAKYFAGSVAAHLRCDGVRAVKWTC